MAVSVDWYDRFPEFYGDNSIDMDFDTFNAELYNSTHTFTGGDTQRSDVLANALATNFGYTNPGQAIASITWTTTSAIQTWDGADITWTASGGSIGPARHMLIYDLTSASDLLGCDVDFGTDETAGDGTDFKITVHASGFFTGSFA